MLVFKENPLKKGKILRGFFPPIPSPKQGNTIYCFILLRDVLIMPRIEFPVTVTVISMSPTF